MAATRSLGRGWRILAAPIHTDPIARMHCSIYKGRRAPDTYLFLPVRDDFSAVPGPVLQALGEPIHVMDLVLHPGRGLARADAIAVMRSLLVKGCYVQLPPREGADGH